MFSRSLPLFAFLFCLALTRTWSGEPQPPRKGVPITYTLPDDGPLPRTFLVTLAIVDPGNPDWIISTFVAGEPREVTGENQGRFTETWDGLDENKMPVPPGDYAVKGIYMPAKQWPVDGEWHAITPKFAGGASPWLPSPDQWQLPLPFGGDPVNTPLRDVAVGPNGVAVFYYGYLENGLNAPMFDLHKPIGYDQFLGAFKSGGAAGGSAIATDGETVWAYSTDGGPKYVYRTDGKSFGSSPGANRTNSYLPEGVVTAMAAWREPTSQKAFVYIAQERKFIEVLRENKKKSYAASETEFVNRITIHDGEDGKVLATLTLPRPIGLAIHDGKLYALHAQGEAFAVSAISLEGGLPKGEWKPVFKVPGAILPGDLEIDSHGRFYLCDAKANKVCQLDASAKVLRTYGRLAAQKPGSYDRETFMEPTKLATWKDADGNDRLLVVESAGPNRVSEWSAEDGTLLREFLSYQTKANNGYAVDPGHPEQIYLPGHQGWLTRFKVDYDTREWKVDAVWPNVEAGQRKGLDKPVAIRANGRLYLASEQNTTIYRLDGERWLRSAGIIRKEKESFFWHDANGNGEVDDEELTPAELPGIVLTYHGQKWLSDLSYIAPLQRGREIWRLAPDGFDPHGNPIFRTWQKLAADPILEARAAGTADALHGGNELGDTYSSDWMQADGSLGEGFYVQARGGKPFDANHGPQHKISYFMPDGKGGFRLKWRVGRTVLQGRAERGEIYGAMRLFKPINGLLSVVDQSRCGVLIYTQDGLYVDTLFVDGSRYSQDQKGVYALPGEFFAGTIYPVPANGKIYFAAGKYTPTLFEMEGWSLKENPVRPLATVQEKVSISAAQIAAPSEEVLSVRGGAGSARVARFSPALGGAALDGSMAGWEAAEPVRFAAGKEQEVEVRCLYDADHLYLRWHARLGSAFELKPLPPLERIFTHDQASDTVGFYVQGDVNARPGGPAGGRKGDVRFVFGIFRDGETPRVVGVGFYPDWKGKGQPQTYRTIVGETSFAHVGAIKGAELGYAPDPDGKGFVIAAAIPRTAIPAMQEPFGEKTATFVNFDASFGGHNKFWWANSDGSASRETYDEPTEARLYPGSWALALFKGIEGGVVARNWLVCGPFGGAGAEKFNWNPRNKQEVQAFYEKAVYPPDAGKVDPDARFEGEIVQGYWKDPGPVRWKPAMIENLDTRVIMGLGSQVWYGATWIYAPAATDVTFQLQGHAMTYLRWSLNGEPLTVPKYEGKRVLKTADQPVTLKPGWNQVFFRGYCVGYSPFRVGLVVNATPDILWTLRFSGMPPQ